MRKRSNKLSLNRSTVRNLAPDELAAVPGGTYLVVDPILKASAVNAGCINTTQSYQISICVAGCHSHNCLIEPIKPIKP